MSKKYNLLLPIAGRAQRFLDAGYTMPKPLIMSKDKHIIDWSMSSINTEECNMIFAVRLEHINNFSIDDILREKFGDDITIVVIDRVTDGSVSTCLLAKEHINNNNPLFFANSDQFVEWDSNEFLYKMNETNADGGIVTFKATHPKWSFAKLNDKGLVTEVAEKNPISDIATVGYYYWKKGSDFVKYAEQMIKEDIRVNNEFYVCPVFNEAIKDNKQIRTYNIEKMWGLGTPEDLKYYIENYK